jgi:hypothetical protein
MREPSAARALYPHLRQGTPEPVSQRKPGSLSAALWPSQTPEAKAREGDQRTWDAIVKRNRDALVRGLREANANLDRKGKG